MSLKYTFDIIDIYQKNYPEQELFHAKKSGKWVGVKPAQFAEYVDCLAALLYYEGIQQGEIVASIFSYNTYEWNIIDLALARIGAIHLPVYPTISDSDYIFILNQAHVRWVFITDQGIYNKISELQSEIPSIQQVLAIEQLPNVENLYKLIERSPINQKGIKTKLTEIQTSILPETICTILYTSGTTGFPKGVMLSHQNLCSNTITSSKMHPIGAGDRVLSFLPMCHIYERTSVYQFLLKGAQVYFAENINTFLPDVKAVQPHGLTVVPRMLEKIIIGLRAKSRKTIPLKRIIIQWSLKWGFRYNPLIKLKRIDRLKHYLYDALVYRHLRKVLGGCVKYIGCGGALSNSWVIKFCWAAGLPVYEGYGLSECSPLVTLNAPGKNNFMPGTVGKPIDGVRVELANDGEILVQGPNVIKSYFKNPEESSKAIKNNWLHTGDLGEINPQGFLRIIGRKKEMFKTSYGKYIVPQAIESLFTNSSYIEHVVIVGEGKHYAAAVIEPNFDFLQIQLARKGKVNRKKLIADKKVNGMIKHEVDKVNKQLGKAEQIKKYLVVEDKWTVESGELSATQKLKRNVIIKKYTQRIHELYRLADS